MVFYRGLLSYLFEPLLTALSAVAAVIVWVVFVPIAFLLNLFNDLLIALFSRDIDQEAQRPSPRFDRGPEDRREPLEEASGEGAESLFDFVQLVEWALLALVALVLLYVLAMAFRRVLSGGRARSEGQRESVREEADPMSDVARLLWQLLPDWLKQRRAKDGLTLPDGPPGDSEPVEDLLSASQHGGGQRHRQGVPSDLDRVPADARGALPPRPGEDGHRCLQPRILRAAPIVGRRYREAGVRVTGDTGRQARPGKPGSGLTLSAKR